jgi:hypothetical protein
MKPLTTKLDNMKSILLFLVVFTFSLFNLLGNPSVSNPVADYSTSLELSGRTAYKWNLDINNDGKVDVLLDVKPNSSEIQMRGNEFDSNNMRWFTAYISTGTQFIKSSYIQAGVGQVGEIVAVKTDECYVGSISEISACGIISIERTSEKSPESGGDIEVARIYAYTVDGETIKKTKLAEFDPDENNAVYSKYLSPSKRTQVNLQEVSL